MREFTANSCYWEQLRTYREEIGNISLLYFASDYLTYGCMFAKELFKQNYQPTLEYQYNM